jgi:hypothetical protein
MCTKLKYTSFLCLLDYLECTYSSGVHNYELTTVINTKREFEAIKFPEGRSPWPRGLRHEMYSVARTLGS